MAADPQGEEGRLQGVLGEPVWRVRGPKGAYLVNASSGEKLPPLTEAQVHEAARRIYTGDPTIVSSRLLTEAPLEMQAATPPFWQIEFAGWNRPTLYISPPTGAMISRRHNLCRLSEFDWMYHILD